MIPETEISQDAVNQLVLMGFDRDKSVQTLRSYANNFEFSLNHLLK